MRCARARAHHTRARSRRTHADARARAQEPANVTLHSLRVALLYRGLQICFIVLIAFTLFGERKYFANVPATASYYVYASPGPTKFDAQLIQPPITSDKLKFCDNTDYDFVYSDNWDYTGNSCRDFSYGEIIKKNTDYKGLFITTYVTETWYNRNIPSDSLTGEVGSMLNTTSVATHKNFFVPGVEDIVITVQAERLNTNVDGCLGEKCRKTIETVIQASDEANNKLITSKRKWTTAELEEGKLPNLPLSDWLALAGVTDLDAYNTGDLGSSAASLTPPLTDAQKGQPSYRLTGVQINVEATYSNNAVRVTKNEVLLLSLITRRLSPNARPTQPGKNGDANLDGSLVKCVYKVLSAKGKWSALGPDVGGVGGSLYGSNFPYDFVDSYKYGISFQVEVTGQLGRFDY